MGAALQVMVLLATAAPQETAAAKEWVVLSPARAVSLGGATFVPQPDGSLLLTGTAAPADVYTLEFEALPKGVTGLRIEALADPSLPAGGPGRSGNGNFVLTELRAGVGPKGARRPRPVALQSATADFAQDGLPATAAIDGVATTGWAIHPKAGADHHLVVETRENLQLESHVLTLELEMNNGWQNTIGRLRVSATTRPRPVRAAALGDARPWSEVQGRVNRAIDRGCDWLLSQQLLDGAWDADPVSYRNGGTALATYALLKSAVPRGHPAIVRALEFMKGALPRETYSLSCQLLALHALDDPAVDPWIRQLGEQLVQFQQPNGGFSYGFQPGIDLSNTQYGALGLRVAAQHGFRMEPQVWEKLAGFVLAQADEAGGGAYAPIGFYYAPNHKPTGSITAAGVGVLAICAEQLKGRAGKLGNLGGLARRGAEWLGQNFAVDTNPRADAHWLYYYLYGLERVGALLDVEEIGGHRWYREGARWLVDHQDADGKWPGGGGGPICSTSWALLFLTRATAPSSGKSTRSVKTYGGDDPAVKLSIRASGDTPLTFWISSWGDAELETYEWPGEARRGLRVKQVEWLATGLAGATDEVPIARVERDPGQPCGHERFGAQHSFALPGRYSIFARARVLAPPATEGAPAGEVVLESPLLEVKIDEATDPELLQYARDPARNLLLGQKLAISASSILNDGWKGEFVANGLVSRGWAGGDQDPRPSISIELEKPVRANLVLVTPAVISPDRPSRVTTLGVTFNGRGPPIALPIDPAPNRKTRLRLPQVLVVRRIDLAVTGVSAAEAPLKSVGLAEVELVMESSGRK